MRPDQLSYWGNTDIRLYGIGYDVKFDIGAIQEFEARSGKDFNHLSMQIITMWTSQLLPARIERSKQQDADGETPTIDLIGEAAMLTSIISRADAAHLFYVGAKAANKQVTFDEIQEGVMLDGSYRRKINDEEHPDNGGYTESYPLLFVNVILELQKGAYASIKKKKMSPATVPAS